MSEVEHVLAAHNQLGEGALWSVDEQALYWVDIERNTFSRFQPATGIYETVDVGVPIGVLALRTSGGLVMATKKGFALWDKDATELCYIINPEFDKPHLRFNRLIVEDASGLARWADAAKERSIASIPMARSTSSSPA